MPIHVERLNHLIDVLGRVAEERRPFDINSFARTFKEGATLQGADSRFWNVKPDLPEPCGTAACACGYAGMDPQFIAEGFRLLFTSDPNGWWDAENCETYDPAVHGPNVLIASASVAYEDLIGAEAAERFFGINDHAFEYLFEAHSYADEGYKKVTARDVIRRVRRLLDGLAPSHCYE